MEEFDWAIEQAKQWVSRYQSWNNSQGFRKSLENVRIIAIQKRDDGKWYAEIVTDDTGLFFPAGLEAHKSIWAVLGFYPF